MDIYTGESPAEQNGLGQGSVPYVTDLRQAVLNNTHFFAARWTSRSIQFAHMSVPTNTETGLDVHYSSDRFFYVEQGEASVTMGFCQECIDIQTNVHNGHAIIIPAGVWHNVINISNSDLKMYTIYAPAFHSHNAVYRTKDEWIGHYEP